MGLGYRAILRLDDKEDAVAVAESQLRGWFLEKKNRIGSGLETADWDGPGIHRLGPDAELVAVHAEDGLDGSSRRLYRYRETNQRGTWVVSVYALSTPQSRGHQQSLIIEAGHEGSSNDEAVQRVDPPRLVRRVLETTVARDGFTELMGSPRVVRSGDVDEVLDAIMDPARTASVIVAASPWREHEMDWVTVVTNLTRQSVGVATTFVVDEDATAALAGRLPRTHTTELGVVRTFAPHVDLESPADGLRHRMLGPATLARSLDGSRVSIPLVRRHAESTRRRFIESELPSDIRRGLDILARAEIGSSRAAEVRRRLSEPVDEESTRGQPAEAVDGRHTTGRLGRRLSMLVGKWLKRDERPEDAIESLDTLLTTTTTELGVAMEQIDAAIADAEGRDSEIRELRTRVDDLSLDVTVAEEAARRLEREVQILRQRLVTTDRAEDTHVEPMEDVWEAPDDIAELVARISSGPAAHLAASRVVFTGDIDAALEVDEHEKTPRYAYAFWDYVHVLFDFAEGRAEGRIAAGFHAYLKSDAIAGHKCSPERHAATESETVLTKPAWRQQRVLPVPVEVDESGRVLMDAHFKPTWRDSFAPRMHYYDDTARTGKIYVGYIGRHLKNTKSD